MLWMGEFCFDVSRAQQGAISKARVAETIHSTSTMLRCEF
jgi:hypothetical protein